MIILFYILVLSIALNGTSLTSNDALTYFETYGYVKKWNPLGTEHDNSWIVDNRLKDGLKTFQKMYHLPVTGELDVNTTRLMLSPRCGNKDLVETIIRTKINRRFRRYIAEEAAMWNHRNISYKVISFPTSGLARNKVRAIIKGAFNMWARVTQLDFYEIEKYYDDADIVIKFGKKAHGDSIPFDGPGKVLAHAFFPHKSDTFSLSGDAHFDDDEHYTYSTEGNNLLSVAVHELGHSLGLGHSMIQNAIMYPLYRLPTSRIISLHNDDIQGIQSIYGYAQKNIPKVSGLPADLPTPLPTQPPPEVKKGPNMCNTSVDSVSIFHGRTIYVFKNNWQWRVKWSKTPTNWYSYELDDGPMHYTYFWAAFLNIAGAVDSFFENYNQETYFFIGQRFWILDGISLRTGISKDGLPLTDLGLPASLDKIDTMFNWGDDNNVAYIFAGKYYWKFLQNKDRYGRVVPAPRYPRLIANVWYGVPDSVDAAYTDLHGDTYFFKGHNYYSFNNYRMSVRTGFPKPARLTWLGCKSGDDVSESSDNENRVFVFIPDDPVVMLVESHSSTIPTISFSLNILLICVFKILA